MTIANKITLGLFVVLLSACQGIKCPIIKSCPLEACPFKCNHEGHNKKVAQGLEPTESVAQIPSTPISEEVVRDEEGSVAEEKASVGGIKTIPPLPKEEAKTPQSLVKKSPKYQAKHSQVYRLENGFGSTTLFLHTDGSYSSEKVENVHGKWTLDNGILRLESGRGAISLYESYDEGMSYEGVKGTPFLLFKTER
ncbi:MAG: hypothetical protein HQL32_11520 [Planctomycetes bacterium]|nr:hypothetical protein [Planctomycetota bacterium]